MVKHVIQLLKRTSIYADHRLIALLLLGFVSGLPFLLTLSTLSRWLAEEGISNTTIGMFMLVTAPYSCKFLWAPMIDSWRIPVLTRWVGQKRSWLLLTQLCLIASLMMMARCSPVSNLGIMAFWALLVAFFSATQDIVVDAYRIEIFSASLSGAGAAIESIGFKFGMLASGAGALYLASGLGWMAAYQIMASLVIIGMITVWFIPEPPVLEYPPESSDLARSFWQPCLEILKSKHILHVLSFILFFKFGDVVLQAMSAPFLHELGVSKIEFATITKVFGIGLMVLGGLFAGILINYLGVASTIVVATVLQSASCMMFALLAIVGYDKSLLWLSVCLEGFCSGIVTSVFIAYLSSLCVRRYTASHFTLLYSFGSLCRVVLSMLSGWLADYIGWTGLFFLCAWASVPVIFSFGKLKKSVVQAVVVAE